LDDRNWFGNLMLNWSGMKKEQFGQNPDEMIKNASRKAFAVSSAAGIVPGPIGWATIIPEMITITKIQINLVRSIAENYGKSANLNSSTVLLVFANELGLSVRGIARKAGGEVIVSILSQQTIVAISKRIGVKIGGKVSQRLIGRIVPFILAPVFGKFSQTMTERIGKEAVKLFSERIVITEHMSCSNGHQVSEDAKYCPECGIKISGYVDRSIPQSLKNTEYFYLEE